ncbi:MAG TPA: carboxypeptidase regulatory-like domain-containing protein, partial [Longimicrobium sp.]|nr:carboxypeptidase regulatory-like domain-containing protein [Longimicrobium sp.]
MKILRILPVLAALCLALPAAAQERDGGLTPFRSDGELTRYLRQMQERAEAARRAQIAAQPPAPPSCSSTADLSRGTMSPAGAGAVITGTVVNTHNQPAANAAVTLSPGGLGAVSGADGSFRLTVPAAQMGWGAVSVRVAAIGHGSIQRETTLAAGDSVRIGFRLCMAALHLDELVVAGVSARAADEGSAAEGITNNQHAGVD